MLQYSALTQVLYYMYNKRIIFFSIFLFSATFYFHSLHFRGRYFPFSLLHLLDNFSY